VTLVWPFASEVRRSAPRRGRLGTARRSAKRTGQLGAEIGLVVARCPEKEIETRVSLRRAALFRLGLAILTACAIAVPSLLPRTAHSQSTKENLSQEQIQKLTDALKKEIARKGDDWERHPPREFSEAAQRASNQLDARRQRLPLAIKSLAYIESFTPFFRGSLFAMPLTIRLMQSII